MKKKEETNGGRELYQTTTKKLERQNHNERKRERHNIHKNRNILTSAEPDESIQHRVRARARTRTHAREYHKERNERKERELV